MWSPLRHHLGYEKIRRNKLLYNVVVCRSCWPCPINACLLRKEVQAVLLECLSAGSWLVKYSPEIWFWGCCFFTNIWQFFSFFTQTQQQCFYLLSSKWSSWVIIINIFHIWCSVVGGNKGRLFPQHCKNNSHVCWFRVCIGYDVQS